MWSIVDVEEAKAAIDALSMKAPNCYDLVLKN